MNTLQYDYFINNEPNFKSILEWETNSIDAEFTSAISLDNSGAMNCF